MFDLSGKTALVTGATGGIGASIARTFHKAGATVAISGRQVDKLEALKAELGDRIVVTPCDLGDREQVGRLIDEATKALGGRLDILVNNAGVAPLVRDDILNASEESFDRLISINLKGPYFLTQSVANWMIEQKNQHPERRYKIINISSISAYTASPIRGEYCVSKSGISMMTALYAARLAEYGIGVYEIQPGIIDTDMSAVAKERYDKLIEEGLTPIRRWGKPEDIGKAAVAIAKDLFPFSTGEVFNVDGGFHLRIL